MHKTILLTGGAGFVGSNLALFLKRDFPATKVIVLDNLKRRGSELNIERFKKENIVYVHGDLRNPEDIANTGPFDLLIDCAAEPSVMSGYQGNTQYVVNTNLNGTVNCLEVLKNYKADLIFLSSSRVYPFQKINALKYKESNTRFDFERNQAITGVSELGISEAFPLDGARTLYGATKLASELMIEEYCDMYGLKTIINRCGVLTGPWQFGKIDQGIIVLWLAKHFYKSTLSYIGFEGSGKQVRDILHIEDLYSLLKIQIQNFNQHSGKIYNVGGGIKNSVSLLELTQICQELTCNKIEITKEKTPRLGDIPWYVTDNNKINQATNWTPRKDTQQIANDIFTWIKSNQEQLKNILG